MQATRICLMLFSLTILFVFNSQADIVTWVDKDGVRHYSNVDSAAEGKDMESLDEYRPDQSSAGKKLIKRNNFKVLDLYKEDQARDLEEKNRKSNERARRAQEAAKKAAKEKKTQQCKEYKQKLEDLRKSGWKNFESADIEQHVRPYRVWTENHGRLIDNNAQRIADRNRARQRAYEDAIRKQERMIQFACGR